MTQITKAYRLRVYGPFDAVYYTYTTQIASAVTAGGQTVRPVDCATESVPWIVEVVDASEAFTAALADADGRAQLLMRKADISVSVNDGGYAVLATGRIAQIELSGQAAYRISVSDERIIERRTRIFTSADTTRAYPPGIIGDTWGPFDTTFGLFYDDAAHQGVCSYLPFNQTATYDELPPSFISAIEGDIKSDLPLTTPYDQPGAGSFDTFRARVALSTTPNTWTEYEVVGFGALSSQGIVTGDGDAGLGFGLNGVWLYDPAGTLTSTDGEVELYFPGHEPTPDLPLHIDDIHPIDLLQDIYDGAYQGADSPQTVRYDAAQIAYLKTKPWWGKVRFRITQPATMASWLQENIYKPYRIAPLIGPDGEIVPTFIGNPTEDMAGNAAAMFEFNAQNSRAPSFRHPTADQVTVITTRHPTGRQYLTQALRDGSESALDRIHVEEKELVREHDRATEIGVDYLRREVEVALNGVWDTTPAAGPSQPGEAESQTDRVALDYFSRFGDGPIYASVFGLSATGTVEPGDYVRLNHATFPNLALQARGGQRVCQVLSRTTMPDGYQFEMMEIGPYSTVLTPPTLTVERHTGGDVIVSDDYHTLRVAFSGIVAGGFWELWAARTSTAIEPAEDDPAWRYLFAGTQDEIDVSMLKSCARYWFRARTGMKNRVSSDWSTAVTEITSCYSQPTSLAISQTTSSTARLTWTQQYDYLDLEVFLDGAQIGQVIAGATNYLLYDLAASTSYTVGIRYVDPYGGASGTATLGFTTTATQTVLNPPRNLAITVGDQIGTRSTK